MLESISADLSDLPKFDNVPSSNSSLSYYSSIFDVKGKKEKWIMVILIMNKMLFIMHH